MRGLVLVMQVAPPSDSVSHCEVLKLTAAVWDSDALLTDVQCKLHQVNVS